MTKLLKTETFSTVWSSFFYFPFHITVSLPYYLLWIVNQLRCNLISLSTQPCVQTLVYRVKECAWVIISRMEKQLLLSARKITTCLEIQQFVVMVECGTVKHQNAKVIMKTNQTKKTSTVIMPILICQMIEWICGTFSLFTVWKQIDLGNYTPLINVSLHLSSLVWAI